MRYHPDRNKDPRAAQAFILVNEAYAYLSDPNRRSAEAKSPNTGRARDEARRKARHHDWEAVEREAARYRAAKDANSSAEQFEQSKVFKAARVVDKVYNYVFLLVGIMVVIGPLLTLFEEDTHREGPIRHLAILFPVLLGIGFLYGIWYFIFKLREEF
jgi:curved DNA-binding protein CbpA